MNAIQIERRTAVSNRLNELAKIKWVLKDKSSGQYAGQNVFSIILTDREHATVFDGRDDKELKVQVYNGVTGANFEVKLV